MAALALLALLAWAPPSRAATGDAPRSGTACLPDAERTVTEVFGQVARAAGLTWSGTRGTDPATGREVLFVYAPGQRMAGYDCDAGAPAAGASVASMNECEERFVVVFGSGLCEAARSRDEIAFAGAHELAHVLLNHVQALDDFNERSYESWFASSLGREERARLRRELGPSAPQERLEDALWRSFLRHSRRPRERFMRGHETQADQEGINLMGQAGYSRDDADDILRHASQLRAALDISADTRHPPGVVRQRLLQALAAELRGSAR